jgi:hypothetical protein
MWIILWHAVSELPEEVTPYHVRLYYEIYQKWRQLLREDILPPLSEYGSDPCIWPLSHSEGFVVKWDLKYQNGDILLNILMSYSFELDSANFLDPKSSSSTRRRSCNCPGGNYTWRCDSYFASWKWASFPCSSTFNEARGSGSPGQDHLRENPPGPPP